MNSWIMNYEVWIINDELEISSDKFDGRSFWGGIDLS